MARFDSVAVIGLGYIGLPTAAVFADNGVETIGVDLNAATVDCINDARSPISEPELDVVLRRVVQGGRLRAVTSPEPADAFVIAVPTPLTRKREPDISCIEQAALDLAPALRPGNLVVLESTSPVGTTERLSHWLAAQRPDLTFPHEAGELSDIRIAHCPERVLPGRILNEVVNNARVIGGLTRKCAQSAMALYRLFVRGECHLTDARTAEMAKLSENAFRDVNIAFANELSLICEKLDVDVWELIEVANLHPRVNILSPGPGVGGHCIAVDPWFIVAAAPGQTRLISAARQVNDGMPDHVVGKVKRAAEGLREPVIACLGLAYKADIDDMRESPAIEVVERLVRDRVGEILLVEPNIDALPHRLGRHGLTLSDFDTAVERADILVLLVDHRAFAQIDREVIRRKIVIDTRGVW
jgi:UDP-N-acetyl-D-mannosaminuronic acid dehydrogenase